MLTPLQRAELRRLRDALPPQELFFDYFESLNQMMAYDADRDSVMTHIADEPAGDDTSTWLLYVAYAATVAPALLDALDAAEARAAELERREARTDARYFTGTETDTAIPHVGVALATEIYDRCAADPMVPIATCDTADEARELVARLNAAEARVAELETAARRMFNADGPRNEIAAERELKRLVEGGAE